MDRDDFSTVDLHTHLITTHERETEKPNNQVLYPATAKKKGLDALFQTEHNLEPYTCNYSDNIWRLHGARIFPGIEISTVEGHVIVNGLGVDEYHDLLEKFGSLINRQNGTSRLKLEHLLGELRGLYGSSYDEPLIEYPHAFQQGGVLHTEKKQKPPKNWLPPITSDNLCFYELTNGHRSADSKNAQKVSELVRSRDYNVLLVGGSDCNNILCLGHCGNALSGDVSDFSQMLERFKAGEYIVYHIMLQDELVERHPGIGKKKRLTHGRLHLITPDASSTEGYSFQYRHGSIEKLKRYLP